MEDRMFSCHGGYVSEGDYDWSPLFIEELEKNRRGRTGRARLKLALPNGTLEIETWRFLASAGIHISRGERRLHILVNHRLVKEVLFARPQHIPELVSKGICHVGICGRDWVLEKALEGNLVEEILELPCGKEERSGKTRVVLFCQKGNKEMVEDIDEVVSEYPHLTENFFRKQGRPVTVRFSHGTTETLVPTICKWGVCLTETGQTLRNNGLVIVEVIAKSSTILIASLEKDRQERREIEELKELLERACKYWRV